MSVITDLFSTVTVEELLAPLALGAEKPHCCVYAAEMGKFLTREKKGETPKT